MTGTCTRFVRVLTAAWDVPTRPGCAYCDLCNGPEPCTAGCSEVHHMGARDGRSTAGDRHYVSTDTIIIMKMITTITIMINITIILRVYGHNNYRLLTSVTIPVSSSPLHQAELGPNSKASGRARWGWPKRGHRMGNGNACMRAVRVCTMPMCSCSKHVHAADASKDQQRQTFHKGPGVRTPAGRHALPTATAWPPRGMQAHLACHTATCNHPLRPSASNARPHNARTTFLLYKANTLRSRPARPAHRPCYLCCTMQ